MLGARWSLQEEGGEAVLGQSTDGHRNLALPDQVGVCEEMAGQGRRFAVGQVVLTSNAGSLRHL